MVRQPSRPSASVLQVTVLAAVVLAAISAAASSGAVLEPFGLNGHSVTSLGLYGRLYAGTLDHGVLRTDLFAADWTSLGLEGIDVRAVYPHPSGSLGFATTVGIQSDPLDPDLPLIYCSEMDQLPWVATDGGLPRLDVNAIWSLDGFPSPAVCGETFATSIGSPGGVWRRGLASTEWELVLDIDFGVGNVVRVDPFSGNVWAGGENAVLAPWIARSTDQGDTWQVTYLDLAGDNACNALAIRPDDPDVAYAGMEGLVIETADGGATWTQTGLTSTQAYIYGVALDSAEPEHILAGGTVTNPNTWALWESLDAGQTWQLVLAPVLTPPETVSGIDAILADPTQAGTFYLATRGHGVWRYRHVVTSVVDPPDPRTLQVRSHPNPFHQQTTLSFDVPARLDGAAVRLAIYDARGELVRVLVDEARAAGPHHTLWDGRDGDGRLVASSVYHGRLRVGTIQRVLKLSFLKPATERWVRPP